MRPLNLKKLSRLRKLHTALKPSSFFLIFVLLLMSIVIGLSLRYPHVETKLLPLIVGSIVFILAAVELWKEIVTRDKTSAGVQEQPPQKLKARGELRPLLPSLGWMVGFLLSIYLLGFLIAIPLFVFSYMKRRGRGWLTAIGFAVIVTAFLYGVFELGLKAHLYPGLIFGGR